MIMVSSMVSEMRYAGFGVDLLKQRQTKLLGVFLPFATIKIGHICDCGRDCESINSMKEPQFLMMISRAPSPLAIHAFVKL